jgi:hypothetical protein
MVTFNTTYAKFSDAVYGRRIPDVLSQMSFEGNRSTINEK